MNDDTQLAAKISHVLWVKAGEDQFGEHRGLGVSVIDFKVVLREGNGLLVLENTFHAKGGPARHLHYEQDDGFMRSKASLSLKSGGNVSHFTPATHCSPRAKSRTCGRMSAMPAVEYSSPLRRLGRWKPSSAK